MNINIQTKDVLTIIKTAEFFKRRFPDKFKNMRLEIDCGYFWEWCGRFIDANPERFMDNESLAVWREMKKEGYQ